MRKIILYFLFFASLVSCDSNYRSSIPDTSVYLELVLNLEAQELRTVGGCITYTTDDSSYDPLYDRLGYGGLMVIYGFDSKYYAFDLCCPYELDFKTRVTYDEAGSAVCPVCGSMYDVAWGTGAVTKGPSREGLRKYQVIGNATASGTVLTVLR